jgi:hypothetical protein
MPAKGRGRSLRRFWCPSEFHRPLHRAIPPDLRMIEGCHEILGEHLRMVEHVLDRAHRRAGHALAAELPFSHFDLRPAVWLRALIQNKTRLDPIGTPAHATRLNFDGLLAISYPENGTYQSYVQAFRGGAIEAVCSSITGSGGSIDIRRVEHYIVERSLEYARALDECSAGPPLAVMASVIGVKDRRLTVARRYEAAQGEIADRDQLHLAEVVLDEMPADILSFAQTPGQR